MGWNEIQFVILAFISELLGTLSGFGSSTFFMPLAQIFENYHLVLVLTSALHVFGNLNRMIQFASKVELKSILLFVLPSMLFSFLGALLNPYVPLSILEKILAVFLLAISVYQLFFKSGTRSKAEPSAAPIALPIFLIALSGFLTGLIGTGGAIRGAALMSLGLPQNLFIHLSSLIDIAGDVLRLGAYLYNGYMDWSHWFYLPLLALAAFTGTWIAKKILARIPKERFYKIVSFFILISSIVLFFKT